MGAVLNVADLADSIADAVRGADKKLRALGKNNPYVLLAAATAAGLAVAGGLLPILWRALPVAARTIPIATKIATSSNGRRALTMLAGALAAKRLGGD